MISIRLNGIGAVVNVGGMWHFGINDNNCVTLIKDAFGDWDGFRVSIGIYVNGKYEKYEDVTLFVRTALLSIKNVKNILGSNNIGDQISIVVEKKI